MKKLVILGLLLLLWSPVYAETTTGAAVNIHNLLEGAPGLNLPIDKVSTTFPTSATSKSINMDNFETIVLEIHATGSWVVATGYWSDNLNLYTRGATVEIVTASLVTTIPGYGYGNVHFTVDCVATGATNAIQVWAFPIKTLVEQKFQIPTGRNISP